MMKRLTAIVLLALAVAGCGKTTTLPQNHVVAARNKVTVPLAPLAQQEWDAVVRGAVYALPDGKRTAVLVAGPEFGESVLQRAEQTVTRSMVTATPVIRQTGLPGQFEVVLYTDHYIQQAAPRAPFARYWFSHDAVTDGFGLSTEANLAAQFADQSELLTPKKTGPANPIAATGAVERYQKGQVKALPNQEIEVGKSQE